MAAADTLEYLAVRAAAAGLAALPPAGSRAVGDGLGWLAHRLGARREVVRAQIAAAFPDRGERWVEDTAAACYRHFGREAAEIVRLQRTGIFHVPDRVAGDPALEARVERMAAGEGTLVVTGHIGNWEIAGALLAARGVPLAAVVKRQRNARFDAWLAGTRRRLGIEPVYMDEARSLVPELLAAGRSVALVADQDARTRGLDVTFLGRPASTFRGPARLALEARAPLVFGVAVRDGDGYLARVEPVWSPAGADRGELELTRAWVRHLERWVRERPEQYFWFHRRWKSGGTRNRNEHGPEAVPHADVPAGAGTMATPTVVDRLEGTDRKGHS